MKITIDQDDNLPEGEYELTDRTKLDRAKGSIPFPASDRRILLEYDRIAGRIVKNGNVLPAQSLWDIEKNRSIEQFSNAEVIEVLRRAENTDVSGSLYQKARNEWEQRQQHENLRQVDSLVNEIRELKDITRQNAETATKGTKSANKLALTAIVIAVIGILAQVVLGINRRDNCNRFDGGEVRCTTWFEAGILGTYVIPEHSISK